MSAQLADKNEAGIRQTKSEKEDVNGRVAKERWYSRQIIEWSVSEATAQHTGNNSTTMLWVREHMYAFISLSMHFRLPHSVRAVLLLFSFSFCLFLVFFFSFETSNTWNTLSYINICRVNDVVSICLYTPYDYASNRGIWTNDKDISIGSMRKWS